LIFDALSLCPIINEGLNVLDPKLACAIGFCSSFNSARIVKDKMRVARVRYFVVDDAHPTLKFGQ